MSPALPCVNESRTRFTIAVATRLEIWSAATARRGTVLPREDRVFRALDDRPDALHATLWPVM
jgi:hypothetical protein